MQGGVIGVVDGSFDVVDSFTETVTENDQELQRCLDVERVFSLPSGETAFAGHAAREYRYEREAAEIRDGEVRVVDDSQTTTRHADFVGIPGEFVVVGSGRGTFVFDLIGRDTDTSVERGTFDLDEFFERRGDATVWKAGFSGMGDGGTSGVLHGNDLRTNHDFDHLLDGSTLTQLGLEYTYGSDEVKMTASRSGYVELYQPRAFDASSYLSYLQREIVPHLS